MKSAYSSLTALLGGLFLLFSAIPAHAVSRAVDNTGGTTLLLPYFEADLNSDNGAQTSFRLENTSATAILANVTLWTDLGIPTQNFTVYLVGYDSQTVDLRLLFKHGQVPVTASAGQDPTDTISPRGPLSQDINFASCNSTLPPPPLPEATVAGLRAAHSGQASSLFANQCAASPRSDGIARGYVTVDTVNQCTTSNPTSAGYASGVLTGQSVLIGSYTTLNRSIRVESGGPLVAVESNFGTGTSSGLFPPGQRTFYGSYNGLSAIDQRESLGSEWTARHVNGGALNIQSYITVWRDPGSTVSPFACGGALPGPFPLSLTSIAAFDEQETITIPVAGTQFPLATQRVLVSSLSSNTFGFLYLNLNIPNSSGPTQSWVQIEQINAGRHGTTVPANVVRSTHDLRDCSGNSCGIVF